MWQETDFRLYKIVINLKPHKQETFKVRVVLRKQASVQKEVTMEVLSNTTLRELEEALIHHLKLPLEVTQIYFFTKFYSHEMRSSYTVGEIFKEHCFEIEGKILKKPLLVIKLADSSVEVKRLVTERTRIKELANDLCDGLKLNILSSQLTFFMPGAYHELNPNFTMKQIGLQNGGRLLVKVNKTSQAVRPPLITRMIQTVEMRKSLGSSGKDYLSDPIVKNRSQATQVTSLTDSRMGEIIKARSAKPNSPNKTVSSFNITGPRESTRKMAHFKKHKIFNGLNVVGKCQNPKCIAFGEEIVISMGFGLFDLLGMINNTFCETCPYRDMRTNPPIHVLDIVFKECAWQPRGNKIISGGIPTIENLENNWFVVKDFESDTVFSVLSAYSWARLDVYVKKLG